LKFYLKTNGFAVFESIPFVTAERYASSRTAF